MTAYGTRAILGTFQPIEDSKMVTTEMKFASGVEAIAYFLKQGFTTVDESSSSTVRVMDDGINVVRIEQVAFLEWKATILSVEGI